MTAQQARKLTYADFAAFPDDLIRREIIDGKVLVTPAANVRHQLIVGRIAFALTDHVRRYGGGVVLFAPVDVLLSEHDVVQPDVLFVADDRAHILTEPNVKGAPTLCVEVVSNPTTDRVRKRALYQRAGVPNYWIADPGRDTVDVFRLNDRRYADSVVLRAGDTLTLPELPGFTAPVAEIFARDP